MTDADLAAPLPDRTTADDLNVELCGSMGGHDWRVHEYDVRPGIARRSWRCVWCHGLACGDVSEKDPCVVAHHHRGPHLSRAGATWPLGGDRP